MEGVPIIKPKNVLVSTKQQSPRPIVIARSANEPLLPKDSTRSTEYRVVLPHHFPCLDVCWGICMANQSGTLGYVCLYHMYNIVSQSPLTDRNVEASHSWNSDLVGTPWGSNSSTAANRAIFPRYADNYAVPCRAWECYFRDVPRIWNSMRKVRLCVYLYYHLTGNHNQWSVLQHMREIWGILPAIAAWLLRGI